MFMMMDHQTGQIVSSPRPKCQFLVTLQTLSCTSFTHLAVLLIPTATEGSIFTLTLDCSNTRFLVCEQPPADTRNLTQREDQIIGDDYTDYFNTVRKETSA